MGYTGGRVADLFDPEPAPLAARRMAQRGGRRMTELVKDYTPTDSGSVLRSWRQIPVDHRREAGADHYTSGVRSYHHRARWVEWGVEPHTIRPKDEHALETPEGPRAEVHHPGYHGAHPVARAAAQLEVTFAEEMHIEAERWAAEQGAAAKRHRGIS